MELADRQTGGASPLDASIRVFSFGPYRLDTVARTLSTNGARAPSTFFKC
jgi:hypothetical protein